MGSPVFFPLPEAQKLPYYSSYGKVRLMIHTLCTNHYLDLTITFIICINVITMSLEHYSQPHVREPASPAKTERRPVAFFLFGFFFQGYLCSDD